jgi:two-component system, NarL family, invasion response regulator UvrY
MKTIAILEPHEILRLCLAEVLAHLNYQIIIKSGNSVEFIEKLAMAEELPDIIISEVQLHDIEDISIFRHLRLHYPEIRLLAYSGDDSEWTVDLVLKEGADAFLEKGCSLQQLQYELHRISSMQFQAR